MSGDATKGLLKLFSDHHLRTLTEQILRNIKLLKLFQENVHGKIMMFSAIYNSTSPVTGMGGLTKRTFLVA